MRRVLLRARPVNGAKGRLQSFRLLFESESKVFQLELQLRRFSYNCEFQTTGSPGRDKAFISIQRAVFDDLRELSALPLRFTSASPCISSCTPTIFDLRAHHGVGRESGAEMDGSGREADVLGLLQRTRSMYFLFRFLKTTLR